MRFFIPPIGARIRLTQNWNFTLHRDSKNVSLFHLAGWDKDNVYSSVDVMRSVIVESLPDKSRAVLDYGEEIIPESVKVFWKCDLNLPKSIVNQAISSFEIQGSKIIISEDKPEGAFTAWSMANLKSGSECEISLEEGTILEIDQYSIKRNIEERDSVTLKATINGSVEKFWCDLEDLNFVDFEFLPEDQPWWWGIADRLEAGEKNLEVEPGVSFPDQGPGRTRIVIDSFSCKSVDDIPEEARWLVYRENNKVAFWRVSNSQVEGSKWIEGHRGKSKGYPFSIEASRIIGRIIT